jgi:microcompartment protein CcmK/EutM
MQIARVIGTVVATQKHATFEGAKLLLVQPLTLDDKPRGTALLVVDALGAGVHEKVLIVMEGRAAGEALGRKLAPVDAAVVGIIDTVDMPASPKPRLARHGAEREGGSSEGGA